MSQKAGRIWDLSATSLSSLCVLQCLGLPLLTVVLPVLGQLGDSHAVHIALVMIAVPVTLYVVWGEIVSRSNESFVVAAIGGLSFMVLAVSVPSLLDYETALTLIGGTMLAGAHLWRAFQLQSSVLDNDD